MTIDNVLDVAKSAIDVASKKTNEMVNVSKLKLEVIQLNSELNKEYIMLGKATYIMRKDDYKNEDLELSICESIEELRAKIDDLNQKIIAEKKTIVCPSCASNNDNSNMYCCKCGAKLTPASYISKVESE